MIQRKKLGEIANISAGQGAPQGAENYSEEGTPFVKAGDLFYLVNGERECDIQKVSEEVAKNHRLKLYPKGTVLFAKSGMSCMKGYVYATNAECYVVSHLACIMPFDVDSKYLKYYFEHHKPNQLVKDASYPSISLADIAEMPINVFDDQTEAKIVDNLDAVNSLIAKSKEELGLLDNIVKSRFVEMFGDVIHNDKGWRQHSFSEITSSRLGKMLDAKQQTGLHSYPYLANFNVQWFRFDLKTLNQMDFNEADRVEFALQDGDVLVCEGGEIGRCAVWHNEIQPCFFQKALHRVRCNKSIILPDYLAWWFKYNCDHGGFAAIEGAKATIAHLPGAKLKQLQVTVPPISHQERFAAFVAEVDKSKLAVKQSLEKLETLKKSLMQQYFG